MKRKNANQERITRSEAMSSEEFKQKMEESLANEPVAKNVQLSQISIAPDSLTNGYINVSGKPVHVSQGFFKDLARSLNINATLFNDLNNSKKTGSSGNDFLTKLISAIGAFKGGTSNQQITLIANAAKQQITNAVPTDKYHRIPNKSLFGIAESLMNRHPELILFDVSVKGEGIATSIQLMNSKPTGFAGNFSEDESYKFGISLGNNPTSTQLGDFALRLVCSNGIKGLHSDFRFKLEGLDDRHMGDFFKYISDYARGGFIPANFENKLKLASKTEASFREIERAFNKTAQLISSEDSDLTRRFKGMLAEQYFWGYQEAFTKLAAKGINPNHLTDKQKQFVKTGQCIWDVINSITWLGSHDAGLNIQNRESLAGLGGALFAEEYDLAYADLLR